MTCMVSLMSQKRRKEPFQTVTQPLVRRSLKVVLENGKRLQITFGVGIFLVIVLGAILGGYSHALAFNLLD